MRSFNNYFLYNLFFFTTCILYFILFFYSSNAYAKFCYKEDYINFISDYSGCLAITVHNNKKTYEELKNKKKLVFFIHGDQINPKVTYFDKFISNFSSEDAIIISITRPGWMNNKDHKSDGKTNISNGDNYIPKEDVDPIYRVIKKFKRKYKINNIIIIGHSGGAAIAGILYGRFPNLIKEAVLISCPCIVASWRKDHFQKFVNKLNRKVCFPKFKSKSPHEYVEKIDSEIKINIFVGKEDKNTYPIYSQEYHFILIKNKKNSTFQIFNGDHMSILQNNLMIERIVSIIG